jgi:hypothetical protein
LDVGRRVTALLLLLLLLLLLAAGCWLLLLYAVCPYAVLFTAACFHLPARIR